MKQNEINMFIEMALYAVNIFIILKSMGKIKDLGVGLLLSRLSFLFFLIPILFQGISPLYFFYLIGGFVVIALLLFFIKKSLIARNYAIITIAYLMFSHIAFWGAFIFLVFNFYKDTHKLKKI